MRRAVLTALAAAVVASPTWAIDHRDGPAVQADPSTDIANVYAWMSADTSKVHLVMSVFPGATTASKFSSTALYVFHLNSLKSLADTSPIQRTIVCQLDAAQKITCWGPEGSNELVSGDASATSGLASSSGKMKVFAGLRDDSTFFNIAGSRNATTTIAAALSADPGGCPKVAGDLAIWDFVDGKCGNQALYDALKGGASFAVAGYTTFAGLLANDQLYVQTGSGTCKQYLAAELGVITGSPVQDCGGRAPSYDVVDWTYGLLTGANLPVSDGVSADPDGSPSDTTFPFLGTPNT
jgi:hypothetical protein